MEWRAKFDEIKFRNEAAGELSGASAIPRALLETADLIALSLSAGLINESPVYNRGADEDSTLVVIIVGKIFRILLI